MDCKPFTTADIGQAAFLLATGHRFLGAEHTGRERIAFVFADLPTCSATESALDFANNGPIAGKAIIEALRFFKSVLRDAR